MKRVFSFLLLPLFFLCAGCGPQEAQEQFFTMDTVMSIHAWGRGAEQAVSAARQEIEALNDRLSRTLPDSLVSQLNAHAGDGIPVPLDGETLELLTFSQAVSQMLPGEFDITIAPVMDAWGFTGEERHVPSPEALIQAMSLVDSAKLLLDADAGTARLEQSGMSLDLGAVAKGYAASRAAAVLQDAEVDSALLDLGRNITALGTKTDGSAWRVGVADPEDDSQYLGILAMEDATASTSGGYERWFEEDGMRYHHIIDPKTGYPADSGLKSVTVISPDHLLADALSTALFVAGPEKALDFWAGRTDFELVLCTEDGQVIVTEGLEHNWEFTGEELGYVCQIARR